MRKKRTWFTVFMAGVLSMALFGGCGREAADGEAVPKDADSARDKVTISLWSDQLTEHYATYLQERFPDVDFTFYVATNSTDFYRFKEACGDLPDILTVRRFALSEVAPWKDSLMDLSDSDLANTFHQSYLHSYTYDDGTVNWLPACAEIDSILLNKTLLDRHNIPVPTDYEEFVDTCGRLQTLGIRPFISNFAADYTCMEILQGLSAAELTSNAGRQWRQSYESGETDELSEEVWLPVFERMEEFIDYAGIVPSDLEIAHEEVFQYYMDNETAMVRGTGEEAVRYGKDRESVLMPFYGDTQEDNWYLTYPAFQVAASARAEEDPEREKLIMDIMTAMLNEEGLRHITDGRNIIAYNRDVALQLSPELGNLQPALANNRLYIRLASADMFSVSQQVVQGMINGEYPDAHSAFEAFNDALQGEDGEEAVKTAAHIAQGYSYAFEPEGGSQAASAVMNSLREAVDTQMLVGQASNVAGNISAGDYTLEQLGFLTQGETLQILRCEMTGEQLYRYMDYDLTTPGKRGSVVNDSTLYVSSGFEMEVRKTQEGYTLERLQVAGKDLDRKGVYSVAVLGSETLMQRDALLASGVTDYENIDGSYKQMIVDRLAREGKQLAGPSDYITLR